MNIRNYLYSTSSWRMFIVAAVPGVEWIAVVTVNMALPGYHRSFTVEAFLNNYSFILLLVISSFIVTYLTGKVYRNLQGIDN